MKHTITSFSAVALILVSAASVGAQVPNLFVTSESCMACHNGLVTPDGEDVSIGVGWRGSMMANAARDPYWHAAVRREILLELRKKCVERFHLPYRADMWGLISLLRLEPAIALILGQRRWWRAGESKVQPALEAFEQPSPGWD